MAITILSQGRLNRASELVPMIDGLSPTQLASLEEAFKFHQTHPTIESANRLVREYVEIAKGLGLTAVPYESPSAIDRVVWAEMRLPQSAIGRGQNFLNVAADENGGIRYSRIYRHPPTEWTWHGC